MRQIYDVAAGACTNIMKQLCGPDYRSLAYGFPYLRPQDITCYDSLGAQHLKFDTDTLELCFDLKFLDRTITGSSAEMRSVLDNYFATREVGLAGSNCRKVEQMIRQLLPTGDCTLGFIASTLAVTPRTLQVHLEAQQTSFRQLLEKVRREIATYHLRRGDMQLTQLALVLGYSELSAFSRSFKGWYGVSPRQWLASGNWQE